LVACKSDCPPNSETIRQLEDAPRLKATIGLFNAGLDGVLRGRMLTPDGLDRLIADYRNDTGLAPSELVSTDDNLFLEYSTPKGNVREYDESIADNEAFLGRYRAASPFDATQLQLNALN
jgi:spermidine synthase